MHNFELLKLHSPIINRYDPPNNSFIFAYWQDTAGEFLCYCPQGYVLDSNKDCVDIDECATGDNLCSAATSDCVNTEPG